MTPTISEKLQAIHKELNATGHYNTYLIIESVSNNSITMDCYTENGTATEEERESFSELIDYIAPYFQRRLEKFTEKNA